MEEVFNQFQIIYQGIETPKAVQLTKDGLMLGILWTNSQLEIYYRVNITDEFEMLPMNFNGSMDINTSQEIYQFHIS